jgi:hypothetical protein
VARQVSRALVCVCVCVYLTTLPVSRLPSGRMRHTGHEVRFEQVEMQTFWSENLTRTDHFRDVDGRTILKWML